MSSTPARWKSGDLCARRAQDAERSGKRHRLALIIDGPRYARAVAEASASNRYEDLFDIENRPGAGVRLWGKAVEAQIERVIDAGNYHRQNHAPPNLQISEGE